MLNQDEELWVKELPPQVQELLNQGLDPLADRGTWKMRAMSAKAPSASKPREKSEEDGARAVTLRVPHNAAVQVYDFKQKKAR